MFKRRIQKKPVVKHGKRSRNTYGIVGLGRFGMALAWALADTGAELIVLDRNEDKIRELREYTDNAFVVRALDKKTLTETGIQNCDVAIVCISEQMDTSILTTLHLVSLGVPKVIAKAASAEHGEILEKLGAQVVYPERDMAVRLAHRLEAMQMLDYIQLSERLNITKLKIPGKMVGRTVLDVNLRKEFGVNIIAVENDDVLIETLTPDYIFRKDDILIMSGSREGISQLMSWTEA